MRHNTSSLNLPCALGAFQKLVATSLDAVRESRASFLLPLEYAEATPSVDA